jgi:hypothetical protein
MHHCSKTDDDEGWELGENILIQNDCIIDNQSSVNMYVKGKVRIPSEKPS